MALNRPGYFDCNHNTVLDKDDIAAGTSQDCNGNGIPDECLDWELDCNANGVPDECDVASHTSADCNNDQIPDECITWQQDCNANNVPDACDISAGTSQDCNGNGIPDECLQWERDCNGNGVPDDCEPQADCNANGVQDMCDIAAGTSRDCDANGVPDECDVAGGRPDCNANRVPDDCEPQADCNSNSVQDICDIAAGTSMDCQVDGVPDECQLGGVGRQPAADACADAPPLCMVGGSRVVNIATAGATSDGASTCDEAPDGPDVWFSYTPLTSGQLYGDLLGGIPSIHSACPGTPENEVSCGPFGSLPSLNVTAGVRYLIRVTGHGGLPGQFQLMLTGPDDECARPANDCNLNGIPDECDSDSDGDGVPEGCDQCDQTPAGSPVYSDGCPVHPADFDADRDVDDDDFLLFAGCATDPAVPLITGCEGKDFDTDGDVDQSDFGIFQRCFSGEGNPIDPGCAN